MMVAIEQTDNLDETALRILEAASDRFLHYGYGKTTMSEIAKDCNMSTGNLYRYFPAKMDIAEAFARQVRREQMRKLRAAAIEPTDLSADERLRRFLRVKFKLTYERFHDRPKAYELSHEIINERREFADKWFENEAIEIEKILEMGETDGLFPPFQNRRAMAHIIQDTVYRFSSPTIFHDGDSEELAVELDGVIDLILDAFAWRQAGGNKCANEHPSRMRAPDIENV